MTNWVVCKKYRSLSLGLLKKFIKNNSYIYTNYSASEDVQKILPFFGFRVIDDGTKIYNSYNSLKLSFSFNVKFGKFALNSFLGTKNEKIIKDHLKIGGIFVSSSNRGYLFFKKRNFFL